MKENRVEQCQHKRQRRTFPCVAVYRCDNPYKRNRRKRKSENQSGKDHFAQGDIRLLMRCEKDKKGSEKRAGPDIEGSQPQKNAGRVQQREDRLPRVKISENGQPYFR